jgi:aspartyl-tRNA(Asn)/glutamyl-tRNA(Gln) amidotransferase subunit A
MDWVSVFELVEKLKSGEVKASEVVEIYLEKIKKLNSEINAFVTLNENAVEDARKAEKEEKPLAGLPIAVKDNVETKGLKTTFCSKLYEDYIPYEDAILVERLKKAGAVIVGKTNMPEFGLIAYTDNPLFGPTKNPWDLSKTVGGSSGGSAAAVAAGMIPVATGNDGGGSIRIPASFCGLYGLKPSFGRIPCYPSMPMFIGLHSEGFLTRYVEDTALLLDFTKGRDDRDLYSLPDDGISYFEAIREPIDNVKIAFSPDLGYATVDPEVEEIVRKAALSLEKVGEVEEVKIEVPNLETDLVTKVVLEVVTFMGEKFEEWKKVAYPPYLGFMALADSLSYKDYIRVEERKRELWRALKPVFDNYDFLITPTVAVPPFELGNIGVTEIAGKPVTPIGWMPFTYPFNFTSQPAASLPAGFTKDGLPVGMQIVGKHYDDVGVLRISRAYQEINPWQDKKPKI